MSSDLLEQAYLFKFVDISFHAISLHDNLSIGLIHLGTVPWTSASVLPTRPPWAYSASKLQPPNNCKAHEISVTGVNNLKSFHHHVNLRSKIAVAEVPELYRLSSPANPCQSPAASWRFELGKKGKLPYCYSRDIARPVDLRCRSILIRMQVLLCTTLLGIWKLFNNTED